MHIPRTELIWTYEPLHIMGERAMIHALGDFHFAHGRCAVTLREYVNPVTQDEITALSGALKGFLAIAELTTEFIATVTGIITINQYPAEGRHDVVKHIQGTGAFFVTGSTVTATVRVRGLDGFLRDTRAEQVAVESSRWQALVSKMNRSPELKKLIGHFNEAKRNPQRFLVDLYAIVDFLKDIYDKKANVGKALGDNAADDWAYLERFSNNEALVEGRHPGSHDRLRHATAAERTDCYGAARRLILAYADHRVV